MVKARKYIVKQNFKLGLPKRDDFGIVEEELPKLKDGEFLIKAEWISVDPYLRLYPTLHGTTAPYDQQGYQIGIVIETKNSDYPLDSRVVNHTGWRDYSIINPNVKPQSFLDPMYKLPNILGLAPSLGVGALGMPGVTAYYGLLEVCKPKAGETVVVTGAAGAVGSVVGQIAKIKGCRVIGFAGSDEKVTWLEKELGFDKAFNYKTVDANKAIKEAAPNGVDCYFDNVGGDLSCTIMSHMNDFGRVAICGFISVYNDDITKLPKSTILQPMIVRKQLRVEGLIVTRWNEGQWVKAIEELAEWIKAGKLKAVEHVTEGFDKLYDAFVGMLNGDNFGKAVVKI